MIGTAVTATFHIPQHITEGLTNGTLERVGGVIRDAKSKQVAAWLREIADVTNQSGIQNLNLRLDSLGNLMQLNMAMSALTLGTTVAGFAVINYRLDRIETRLKSMEETLEKIDQKIDLDFYATFRAALDTARKAFTLGDTENRKALAVEVIKDFAKSEYTYITYLEETLKQQGKAIDEYLSMLALIYLAETRCYLELSEHELALKRLEEGCFKLQKFTKSYINVLLTSNPGAYVTPFLREEISFSRLAKVYQWLNPDLTEADVFEQLRFKIFQWHKDASILGDFQWRRRFPSAILAESEFKNKGFFNLSEQVEEALSHLPRAMQNMESAIETCNRLEGYQTEVKAMEKFRLSFQEWLSLQPAEERPENAQVMCILADF
jgi:tetratricopeptide (TPR) repeat protein